MSKINLLPENLKQEIEQSKKNKSVFYAFLGILIFVFSLLGMNFYVNNVLNYKFKIIESSIAEKNQSITDYSEFEKKAGNLNSRIQRFNKIRENNIFWSKELQKIKENTPSNIYLINIKSSDHLGERGVITGNAENKKAVTKYISFLKETGIFQSIDIESVTIASDPYVKRETNNFIISFVVDLNKLK